MLCATPLQYQIVTRLTQCQKLNFCATFVGCKTASGSAVTRWASCSYDSSKSSHPLAHLVNVVLDCCATNKQLLKFYCKNPTTTAEICTNDTWSHCRYCNTFFSSSCSSLANLHDHLAERERIVRASSCCLMFSVDLHGLYANFLRSVYGAQHLQDLMDNNQQSGD